MMAGVWHGVSEINAAVSFPLPYTIQDPNSWDGDPMLIEGESSLLC